MRYRHRRYGVSSEMAGESRDGALCERMGIGEEKRERGDTDRERGDADRERGDAGIGGSDCIKAEIAK